MSKLRVGIIFGGRSAEHEVSLQSARNIVDALDRERFEPVLIGIDKNGHWHLNDTSNFLINQENPALIALNQSNRELAVVPGKASQQLLETSNQELLGHVDVIFPIVHGTLGEDGCLQGLLRMADLPFVGSDVLGSAVCMDKDISKRLLRDAGLAVTPFITLNRATAARTDFAQAQSKLGLPMFVKPANQGSSVGVSKVTSEAQYHAAIELALGFDEKVLVESAVSGREIECAVLGNDQPIASGCGEIVVGSGFYSYDSKYIDDQAAQVVVPADLSEEVSERIRALAVEAFQVLGCSGLARVDVFLTQGGEVLINEINSLPGFTRISMYPKLWQAAGMTYSELVSRLIELALERHAARQALKISR
ncbi:MULTISPECIES: D-alanine--D-alanine ligase [Pseudomonas]|jgi:D-alanine-D-alanine ligase|uniref:D-alanine--D-alanine ligase n=2 Tax=Pseudomonas chlororaphis TaxID=587753 RepID=A0AAD1E949_9PSED|nr:MULTISPECIES: D-alanine--D-alanine ligase [Pseudomonas]AIC22317.1 D-alanine--D-alanine ligase [Pseudomonas chlororaphis]AZD24463.1 D-alanine--D-alanine ligase [Pseudomonas chlororaphis subsp. aurantiaca]AZD38112.1 D-alanine--D-alanine ligase [Pseudomonas chlororaphis subsp. aurantiaca]AZD44453.1 D-alanine--D-alanine ligase [Pseudomonas chlororaphis subsp. aurantiaca]AZD50753.1 D-alanine--D-alanine ligase [Pseudomonas chlororaphis subsp. aurantiaca]